MAERLIALDLDGTTIQHDGSLSPAVRQAVSEVAEAGFHVVIATGRAILAAMPLIADLGLEHGFAVCSNGAVTLELDPDQPDGYRILETVTFDPAPALEMLRGSWPDAVVAVEELGVGFKVSAPFPDGELDGEVRVVPWEELGSSPATRVTFRSPTGTAEDFLALVERIGQHEVSYSVGFTAWLDINPEGVSKASALELIRRRLGVEPVHTVAVGDQRNDIEMLQWAARGVAMGNAPDEGKVAADEITLHGDEDGLVAVLVNMEGDLVGGDLDLVGRIAHRDATSRPLQHLDVVALVADRDGVHGLDSQPAPDQLQRRGLGDPFGIDVQPGRESDGVADLVLADPFDQRQEVLGGAGRAAEGDTGRGRGPELFPGNDPDLSVQLSVREGRAHLEADPELLHRDDCIGP